MKRPIRPSVYACLLAAASVLAPLSAGDLAATLNRTVCQGSPASPTLELCFTPTINLGPVDIADGATVNPNLSFTPSQVGVLGIVRLTIQSGFVEIPAASFDSADPCAPLSVLPFNCTVVVSVPITNPGPSADPDVDTTGRRIGWLMAGTLALRVNGQAALVIPGYADLACGIGGSASLADADCDGVDNDVELSASPRSNPFYKYSKPGDAGLGFPDDWDADMVKNHDEVIGNPMRSNPLQRCSTPANPNGWPTTTSCET